MLSCLLASTKLELLKAITDLKEKDEPIWEKNSLVEKIIYMIGDPKNFN